MKTFDACPDFRAWDGAYLDADNAKSDPTVKPSPEGPPIWSTVGGFATPPLPGARVFALGGFGPSSVVGYFVEHGYLGLRLRPDARPEWHRKQSPGRDVVCMFGAEIANGPALRALSRKKEGR